MWLQDSDFSDFNPNFVGFRIRINGLKLIRNSSDCRISDSDSDFGLTTLVDTFKKFYELIDFKIAPPFLLTFFKFNFLIEGNKWVFIYRSLFKKPVFDETPDN